MSALTPLPMLLDHRAAARPRPPAPRVMVVAPGPWFSTKDVYDGAVAGMRACGAQTLALDYHFDLGACARIESELEDDDKARFGTLTTYASHRAVALALAFQPDLILFISGTVFPPPVGAMLGQYTRTALWLTESPYQAESEYAVQNFYRTVFTNERLMVERLRARRRADGHPYPDEVYYLPHAFDPARHYPRVETDPAYQSDVCFIGSPFPERQALLSGVDWMGIRTRFQGVFAERDVEETLLGPKGNVSNAEAQRYYAGARINLCHHRTIKFYGEERAIDLGEAESLNPRVYELAAGRCFQLCDDSRPELGELFGASVPTYRLGDSQDLERQIRYYLDRPALRAELAAEAHRRVQGHSVAHRMRYVLERCLGAGAPGRQARDDRR